MIYRRFFFSNNRCLLFPKRERKLCFFYLSCKRINDDIFVYHLLKRFEGICLKWLQGPFKEDMVLELVNSMKNYGFDKNQTQRLRQFGTELPCDAFFSGMRIRFWPKTGSGALHVKLREIFKSLLNEYFR